MTTLTNYTCLWLRYLCGPLRTEEPLEVTLAHLPEGDMLVHAKPLVASPSRLQLLSPELLTGGMLNLPSLGQVVALGNFNHAHFDALLHDLLRTSEGKSVYDNLRTVLDKLVSRNNDIERPLSIHVPDPEPLSDVALDILRELYPYRGLALLHYQSRPRSARERGSFTLYDEDHRMLRPEASAICKDDKTALRFLPGNATTPHELAILLTQHSENGQCQFMRSLLEHRAWSALAKLLSQHTATRPQSSFMPRDIIFPKNVIFPIRL